MADNMLIIGGIALLAGGTWLMRFAGATLGNRMPLSENTRKLLSDAATTLLFAVALGNMFYEGTHFAGMARVTGVAVAMLLAWRKVPLIVVIIAAAAVTALLRYIGIS
ncbi:AzlD domain-containing protein [Erwinia sorbitola]|uniref:AzlD domain-containing protein n=1 Tax=Erwinia sorbitola TaxID=2681984 RepID=A0A6I6EB29_9GAMM|nr:AzlD domain-containing protein [Erwinia sorbitola]QGU86967.1 AzlD domain-containing protein [Erwinia sorbitola]